MHGNTPVVWAITSSTLVSIGMSVYNSWISAAFVVCGSIGLMLAIGLVAVLRKEE